MDSITFSEPTWAIIEIMGHKTFVGQVSEVTVAGGQMLRIDVPETGSAPAFTTFRGSASIYSITPTDEETARAALASISPRPVDLWIANSQGRIPASVDDDEDFGL